MYEQKAPGRLPRRAGASIQSPVEEAVGRVGQVRRERAVAVENECLGVVPADLGVVGGQAGHPVVVRQPVEPEDLRLERVPALGQVVAAPDGAHERLHRLVAHLVGQVPARDPGGVVPEAVVHRLVVEQGVEQEGPGREPRLQGGGDGLRRRAPHLAVGGGQPGQALLQRGGPAVEVDLQRRRQLAEQPAPGRAPGHRLLGEHPLLGLAQEVGPVAALGLEVVAVGGEPLVGQQRRHPVVVQGRPLQVEPQQAGGHGGGPLLHPLLEGPVGLVGHVGGEAQAGVRAGPAEGVVEEGGHRHVVGQGAGVEARHLAPSLGQAVGQGVGFVEQDVDRCRLAQLLGPQQVGQVPGDAGRLQTGVVRTHIRSRHAVQGAPPRPPAVHLWPHFPYGGRRNGRARLPWRPWQGRCS